MAVNVDVNEAQQSTINLTVSRRAVLDIVMAAGKPMKAYDILTELQSIIKHAKPPTVYRALDYLVAHHLLHRVNDQNAFVYCQQQSKCYQPHAQRFNVIFSCQACGTIIEKSDDSMTAVMNTLTQALNFVSSSQMLECSGVCQACQ